VKTEYDEHLEDCRYQLGHLGAVIVECLQQLQQIDQSPLISTAAKQALLAQQTKSIQLLTASEGHLVEFQKLVAAFPPGEDDLDDRVLG
jgi:hypothetical protein